MPTIGEDGIVQTINIGTAIPSIAGEQLGQLQTKQYETLSSSDIDTLTIGTGASPSLTIQRVVGGSTVGSWIWTMDSSNNLVLDRITGTGIYVWNELGASTDFRMEGDTDTEVFFLDGSENRVGFSTTTPATLVDIQGALTVNGILSQDDVTDTTSTITGSIHTDGGLGIAKALWVGTTSRLVGAVTMDAILSVDDTTNSTSGTTGSIHTDGGLGVLLDLAVGNDLLLPSTGAVINWGGGDITLTQSAGKLTWGGDGDVEIDFANHEMTNVDIDSGAIDGTVIGAASVANGSFAAVVGTTITGSGILSIDDTTDTTSTTTGSIHTDGGLGITLDLWVGASLNVAGTGPHAVGGAVSNDVQLYLRGSYTSGGVFSSATSFQVETTITGAGGDTIFLTGTNLATSVITQAASENIAIISQLRIAEPSITDNLTGDITVATTVRVVAAPTEGESNYGLWLDGFSPVIGFNVTNFHGLRIDQYVLTATSARTITNAASLYIENAPSDSDGDITVTNGPYAIWVDDGPSRFDGLITGKGGTIGIDIDAAGMVSINDTTNANMTVGLTIDQATNDNEILTLKSSTDVAHGVTNTTETEVYGLFRKETAATGGLHVIGLTENEIGIKLQGVSTNDNTSKVATAQGIITVLGRKKSTASAGDPGADANIFVVQKNASATALFIVDEDGELFAEGGAASTDMVTLYDEYNDAQLSRALAVSLHEDNERRGRLSGFVESKWDEYVTENEQTLIDVGILGGTRLEGGLICYTKLARLHNGAIWQAYCERQDLCERIDKLEQLLLSAA